MIALLKALPDLVRLLMLVLNVYRDLSRELGRAATKQKIEKAIKHAKDSGDTSHIDDIINKRM